MHLSVRLQGCQLAIQPGKPNASSTLPVLPPTRARRRHSAGSKTEIVSVLLVAFPRFSELPARPLPGSWVAAAAPGPPWDALGGLAAGGWVAGCSGRSPGCRGGRAPAGQRGHGQGHPIHLGVHSRAKAGIKHAILPSLLSLWMVYVCLCVAGEGDFLKMDCNGETTSVEGKGDLPAFSPTVSEVEK